MLYLRNFGLSFALACLSSPLLASEYEKSRILEDLISAASGEDAAEIRKCIQSYGETFLLPHIDPVMKWPISRNWSIKSLLLWCRAKDEDVSDERQGSKRYYIDDLFGL